MIFGVGCSITLVMLFVFQSMDLQTAILVLLPALISGFLVIPVPNYHNVMQLLTNIFMFLMNRKRYYWQGWCIKAGEK